MFYFMLFPHVTFLVFRNVEEDSRVEMNEPYCDDRKRQRNTGAGFARGSCFRGGMRRSMGTNDRGTSHRSQGVDFSRGKRYQDFRRDFEKQRRYSRHDYGKGPFSFDEKDSGG